LPEANINGARIYYQEHGEGFPLMLTHGLGSDHTMWINQVTVFKDKYRLVIWDCRGHGQSEVTDDGYSIAQFTDDLYRLMQHLGIERAHIGGLSMGGWISWSFALAHPEVTVSLVLSDSAGMPAGMENDKLLEKKKMFEASAAIAETQGREKLVDVTLSLMFSEEFIKNQPDVIKLVRQRIVCDPGVGYARTIKGAFAEYWQTPSNEVEENLSKIKAPTLIIVGEVDKLTPVSSQKALHRAIPGSRLEIIQGSGHVPSVEQPELWNKLVLEFLDGVEV